MTSKTTKVKAKEADSKPLKRKFTRPSKVAKYQKVLDKLDETGGKIGTAIRETGLFSEAVARNPDRITGSKTWKEMLADQFPDEEIAKKHRQLLESGSIIKVEFGLNDSMATIEEVIAKLPGHSLIRVIDRVDTIWRKNKRLELKVGKTAEVLAPDHVAQDKALDKAYKVKGRYADEQTPPPSGRTTYNFIFSESVQGEVKRMEESLKKMLTVPTHDSTNTQSVESKPLQT